MDKTVRLAGLLGVLLALPMTPASASDACATRAIASHANVSVSDGSSYEATSWYRSPAAAAIRFGDADGSTIAVEGPYAWVANAKEARLASAARKTFALGHQYHALLLAFDEILEDVRPAPSIEFAGGRHGGRVGNFPAGGTALLVDGAVSDRPLGMRFELPDAPAIDVRLDDWRRLDGRDIPFLVRIDDGERVFDYRYSRVSITDESPHWFREALPYAAIDEVQIYRLHRRLMAAHCLGDADLLADLTASESVVANRGELRQLTREQTRQRFRSVFEAVSYTRYVDVQPPQIQVSAAGDIGWAAVNVRTVGARKSDGDTFDRQWAWIMLVRKDDGVWQNAGNASNYRRD